MTRGRIAVAAAGILTVLLLQAVLVGPVVTAYAGPFVAVSLPAVVVAAVAFVDGPATGMSFGFVTGLIADLGSNHPAGVLALAWLVVGLLCGRVVDRHRLRHDAVSAAVVCALAGSAVLIVLAVLHRGGSWSGAVLGLLPAVVGDLVVAVPVVALVRRLLDTDALRKPSAVYTDLSMAVRRG